MMVISSLKLSNYVKITCIILEYIKPCHDHDVVPQERISLTLAIHLYHSSPQAGFQDYILCLYRVVVDKF